MRKLTDQFEVFAKLLFVFRLFGSSFLQVHKLCFVVKRFVWGEEPIPISQSQNEDSSTIAFAAEAESLLSLFPEIKKKPNDLFKDLHEFGLKSNFATGCILIPERDKCRSCFKPLIVEKKTHAVVVYTSKSGPVLGTRVSKSCRKCKITEHYGSYTQEGLKHYDFESIDKEFFLSSEETAIEVILLEELSNLLIVGAVPFATFSASYNRRFKLRVDEDGEHIKR